MQINKVQFIIISGVVGITLLFFLILKGFLPGLQKENTAAENAVEGTLTIWGMFDDEDAYRTAIEGFKGVHPKLRIAYRKFTDEARYEMELLEALAVRRGPDIFMIPSRGLDRNKEKIAFAPQSRMSLLSLRRLFPRVVEEDFVDRGNIGALPLSIDTLVLIYNRNLLNQAGIILPPATWEDLVILVPRLVKKDDTGAIAQAGIALGGSGETVARAADIVGLLALQNAAASGSSLESIIRSGAGTQALDFYKKFGVAESPAYTWSDTMPYSLDAFGTGRAAMILGYSSDLKNISARNSFIEPTIAKAPQKQGSENPVALSRYWGYAVSNGSPMPDIAWQFIIMMTTNEGIARSYASVTGRPPALNALIAENLNNPKMSVFAEQALFARSVRVPDE
ncbi:MAG: extracellular solute-binding protein [Nanoarchaeota archaeon]|nr:extracellular solute-binding protein [Nanoarchaeota archaeon]